METPAKGVQSNVSWPGARTVGRSRDATDGAICATRREAGVTGFVSGPVSYFDGRCPGGRVPG